MPRSPPGALRAQPETEGSAKGATSFARGLIPVGKREGARVYVTSSINADDYEATGSAPIDTGAPGEESSGARRVLDHCVGAALLGYFGTSGTGEGETAPAPVRRRGFAGRQVHLLGHRIAFGRRADRWRKIALTLPNTRKLKTYPGWMAYFFYSIILVGHFFFLLFFVHVLHCTGALMQIYL